MYDAHLNGSSFFGKDGEKYSLSLALNNDKFLHENKYEAFDIERETEIRSSVLTKCSIKEALFKECFFFVFIFIMTSISFSKNLRKNAHKSCENVSFCFCMDIKDVAENVYEVNQELGVANRPPREKKLQIPGGVLWGGGGDIVTSKIEPCIIEEEKYFNGIAVALKISAFKFP